MLNQIGNEMNMYINIEMQSYFKPEIIIQIKFHSLYAMMMTAYKNKSWLFSKNSIVVKHS